MKDKFRVFGNGYRVNRLLAHIVFISMFVLLLPQLVWFVSSVAQGNGLISFSCEGDYSSGCLNPAFGDCDKFASICDQEFLPVGFVYNPVPWFYDLYQLPVLFLFGFFILFNHFMFNKGWRFGSNE